LKNYKLRTEKLNRLPRNETPTVKKTVPLRAQEKKRGSQLGICISPPSSPLSFTIELVKNDTAESVRNELP
jgi:hypothetical protein